MLELLQLPRGLLDKEEIVVKASSFDEGRLVGLHQLIHARPQPFGQELGAKFRQAMNQSNVSEISHLVGSPLLRDECDQRLVEAPKIMAIAKK